MVINIFITDLKKSSFSDRQRSMEKVRFYLCRFAQLMQNCELFPKLKASSFLLSTC